MDIYNTDCLEFMRQTDARFDLIVTSPPYFNARQYSHFESYEKYLEFIGMTLGLCYRVLGENGRIAFNVPDGYGRNPWTPLYADVCGVFRSVGFSLVGSIVWDKGNGAGKTSWGSWASSSDPCIIDEHEMIIVAKKRKSKIIGSPFKTGSPISKENFLNEIHSVWHIKPETSRKHPAPFPIELARRLVEFLSAKGAVVFDPFMGSGTTAIACLELDREFCGCEINKEYFDYAQQRITQFQKEQRK